MTGMCQVGRAAGTVPATAMATLPFEVGTVQPETYAAEAMTTSTASMSIRSSR
jgi:hypothetical protein